LRVSKGNQYREHTERVDVCPVVINGIQTNNESESFVPKQKIILSPVFRGNDASLQNTHWFVNNEERKDWSREAGYEFETTGIYTFRFVYGDSSVACMQEVERTFVVEDNSQRARLA